MTNTKKILSIFVHWQSCKPNGFWSDTFKKELKKEFSNDYKLNLSDSIDNGGIYDDGTTSFALDNSDDDESSRIKERIKRAFDSLKEKHKNGNYEWLNVPA